MVEGTDGRCTQNTYKTNKNSGIIIANKYKMVSGEVRMEGAADENPKTG